jgi:glycosyltransferase involved in cell wall biosynthesis
MRILIVSDLYPPFVGGAERQMHLLSKELVKRGHTVRVATVWHEHLAERENDSGIEIQRLKSLSTRLPIFFKNSDRRYHPPFPDPVTVAGLRRIVNEYQPDIVHATGWIGYSCAAGLLGKDIPLVVSIREYGYSCAVRTMMRKGRLCDGPELAKCLDCAMDFYGKPKGIAATLGVFMGRSLLMRKLRGTHSLSSFVQEVTRRDLLHVQDAELPVSSMNDPLAVVIPNILMNGTSPAQDKSFLSKLPKEPYILFVGAIQPHKGVLHLLDAYGKLRNAPPLVMIGTTWHDTPKKFPPNVVVLGSAPHHDVMVAWENCLFGVAPSTWPETFCSVVLEAMSKGKAVISTNVGGPADLIVHGETGFLIPPNDAEGLRAYMQELIDDPALRERLGRAGKERSKRYHVENIVPQFEGFYRQVMQPERAV